MVIFGERNRKKVICSKKTYKALNVHNLVTSKLVKTKTYSKYLIGYLDKLSRPLVLMIPKISRYVKIFKFKDKNNKLMSFCIDDEKLLKKYEPIWTKIEDLKNIQLNALPGLMMDILKPK